MEQSLYVLDSRGPTYSSNMIGGATFSEDGTYRYVLSRDWEANGKLIVWIMLNPSIGDDSILERTTAGCLKRSQAWGFGAMIVLNLFAYISTDPKELKIVEDPIGKFNNGFIQVIGRNSPEDALFIAAWGNHGKHLNRDKEVAELLGTRDLYCLGINKDGSPRHPLHMSHSIHPELWCGAGDYLLWS